MPEAVLPTAIGALAALCSVTSFAPQLVKILRDRDATQVSSSMFLLTAAGFTLWSTYGILSRAWPLVVSSLVCLAFCLAILLAKSHFDKG